MLMAARAAVGRQGYADAASYLLNLIGDSNCPAQYDAQALFNYGDVLMLAPSSDTNDPLANFKQAIPYFQIVCRQYPNSTNAALAYGEIGNCNYQLGAQDPQKYADATNAYAQVIASPFADVSARSQARLGIGLVLEKLAALTNGVAQAQFLQAALDNYLDVFRATNLRNGETADPLWVREAGLRALPLMESLGAGDLNKFIDQMETVFPQMQDFLEKRRLQISRPSG